LNRFSNKIPHFPRYYNTNPDYDSQKKFRYN
jgi:hypothetical protein